MDFREKLIPDLCQIIEEYFIEYGDQIYDIFPKKRLEKILKNCFGEKIKALYKKYGNIKQDKLIFTHIFNLSMFKESYKINRKYAVSIMAQYELYLVKAITFGEKYKSIFLECNITFNEIFKDFDYEAKFSMDDIVNMYKNEKYDILYSLENPQIEKNSMVISTENIFSILMDYLIINSNIELLEHMIKNIRLIHYEYKFEETREFRHDESALTEIILRAHKDY